MNAAPLSSLSAAREAGQRLVVNFPDGSFAQPTGSFGELPAAPAPVGGIIITYATGLCGVEGMVVSGAAPGVAMPPLHPVEVVIGGVAVLPMFAGLHPTLVGLYQVNAVVPDVPAGEAVPIQLRISGVTSTDQATIAVSQALAAQNLPSPSGYR